MKKKLSQFIRDLISNLKNNIQPGNPTISTLDEILNSSERNDFDKIDENTLQKHIRTLKNRNLKINLNKLLEKLKKYNNKKHPMMKSL